MGRIFSTFALLVTISALSQPILKSDSFLNNYSLLFHTAIRTPETNISLTGSEFVWDFSQLLPVASAAFSTIPVYESPFNAEYQNSNYCWEFDYSMQDAGDYYYHFNLSSQSLLLLGINDIGYSNSKTVFQFPYAYGQVINDLYQENNSIITYPFNSIYDGYGTLITPFNTYNNVIRVKFTDNGFVSYEWWNSNPAHPLMTCEQSSLNVAIYEPSDLKTNNLNVTPIDFYPNPTTGKVFFNNNYSVEIFDSTGRSLSKVKMLDNTLDFTGYQNGVYHVKISENQTFIGVVKI